MTNKSVKKIIFSSNNEELQHKDFDFQRKIGEGGFGQVWRVKHKKTSKLFATKRL